ncbi:hypothetical protein F441_03114, partial [Phytophthora nicotianae CJ01A1]
RSKASNPRIQSIEGTTLPKSEGAAVFKVSDSEIRITFVQTKTRLGYLCSSFLVIEASLTGSHE